jgi:hypothetical protein
MANPSLSNTGYSTSISENRQALDWVSVLTGDFLGLGMPNPSLNDTGHITSNTVHRQVY